MLSVLTGVSSERGGRRRRTLPERVRPWLVRGAIALPGIALACVGIGHPATGYTKVWHDSGLLFFLLAATLPLWRRPERTMTAAMRWRELQRKVLWRAGVCLVGGSILALVAYRWYHWHGDFAAAHAATVTALVLLLLSPVPRLLDRLLWCAWPAPVRRTVRATRVADELGKVMGWDSMNIDVERGVAGRPQALREYAGGEPRSNPIAMRCNPVLPKSGITLDWDGERLAVIGRNNQIHTVRGAAELVWFSQEPRVQSSNRSRTVSLFLLDKQGYRLLTITNATCDWPLAIKVAKAAGLSFAAYHLSSPPDLFDKICKLLFPRRSRSWEISSLASPPKPR